MAVAGLSSTLSLTNRTSSRSSDISSRIGETRRHGTHHGAQKSTTTGFSAFRTSLSNVASVTSATAITKTSESSSNFSDGQSLPRPTPVQAVGQDLHLGRFGELLGPLRPEDAGTQSLGVRRGAASRQAHGLDRRELAV